MKSCSKCGGLVTWVKIGERRYCHNADGSDHWDTCSKLKWQQVVNTGEKFDNGNQAGYANSIHGTKLFRDGGHFTKRANFDLPECDCKTPPWDDCVHSDMFAETARREIGC